MPSASSTDATPLLREAVNIAVETAKQMIAGKGIAGAVTPFFQSQIGGLAQEHPYIAGTMAAAPMVPLAAGAAYAGRGALWPLIKMGALGTVFGQAARNTAGSSGMQGTAQGIIHDLSNLIIGH